MKKSDKNVIDKINIVSAFLIIYFCLMFAITCFYADGIRYDMTVAFYEKLRSIEKRIQSSKNAMEFIADDNFETTITNVLYTYELAQENIYSKIGIYETDGSLVYKTENTFYFLMDNRLRFIFLDDFILQERLTNFNADHDSIFAFIKGFENKQGHIIPEKLTFFLHPGLETKVYEILFDIKQDITGLKPIASETEDYGFRFEERDLKNFTPKKYKRFDHCNSINESNVKRYLENERFIRNEWKKGTIFKCENSGILNSRYYNYTNNEINDDKFLVAYTVVFYPFESAMKELKGLYIVLFFVILSFYIKLAEKASFILSTQVRLERNRKELVSALAHEFKTPLGIIRNYSEALKENIVEKKKDHYLNVIIDETEQMNEMVLEMLDLSRLEANAYKVKLDYFSLRELIEKEINRHNKLIEEKQIKISFKYEYSQNYMIVADSYAIQRIVSNFLSNAVHHTPSGGDITVKAYKNDKKNYVSVENEGENIPEEVLPKIWDSFYRVDSSRERRSGRTGLGLAIARCYLEILKARYGVENTKTGVMFWFEI